MDASSWLDFDGEILTGTTTLKLENLTEAVTACMVCDVKQRNIAVICSLHSKAKIPLLRNANANDECNFFLIELA